MLTSSICSNTSQPHPVRVSVIFSCVQELQLTLICLNQLVLQLPLPLRSAISSSPNRFKGVGLNSNFLSHVFQHGFYFFSCHVTFELRYEYHFLNFLDN